MASLRIAILAGLAGLLASGGVMVRAEDGVVLWAQDPASSPIAGSSVGPDVVLYYIPYPVGVGNYGSEDPEATGDWIAAFSVGTTSCNWGNAPLAWVETSADHPVIRQAIYRLKGGRLEQLGTSWVKHGFYAVNDDACNGGCANPGPPGNQLRPGCSDPYTAALNGSRSELGPSFEINAFTGEFPDPHINATGSGSIRHRVQVRHNDLDPLQNTGALYFVEGHYVTADDAAYGNAENNASHRRAVVRTQGQLLYPGVNCPHPYCMVTEALSPTQIGRPAIRAWKDADASVRETDARVPNEGLYILAEKTTDLGTGFWRYEYALYNLNSDRSAGSFSVPIPEDALVQNAGFHDVHHHSGEPWGTADWTFANNGTEVTWATASYAMNPNANALRWSTLYNFRVDINAPPAESYAEVGLFKPGFPDAIAIRTTGPQRTFIDCNENGVADLCDVADESECAELGCFPETCGLVPDCNDNGVPDSPLCEADCNLNGVPDACDIRDCWKCVGGSHENTVCIDDGDCAPGVCELSDLACGDCQPNTVPDGCEDDCDDNGVPDSCEPDPDADDDGFEDCVDQCPYNTPPGGCDPPASVTCRYNTGFCVTLSWDSCILQGGTPVCGEPPEYRCQFGFPCPDSSCRNGCLIGDWDLDGDIDLGDTGRFQDCFSGSFDAPGYVVPTTECGVRFDFDGDSDVDLADYDELVGSFTDPKG